MKKILSVFILFFVSFSAHAQNARVEFPDMEDSRRFCAIKALQSYIKTTKFNAIYLTEVETSKDWWLTEAKEADINIKYEGRTIQGAEYRGEAAFEYKEEYDSADKVFLNCRIIPATELSYKYCGTKFTTFTIENDAGVVYELSSKRYCSQRSFM